MNRQQDATMGDISSPKSKLNVIIAGLPRSGKSTGLDNIFDLELTVGLSARPVTDKVTSVTTSITGFTIKVTDTPGLTAANANKDKIVMRDIKNVGIQKNFLFILTLRASPISCIIEDYRNILRNLTEIFGKNIWKWSLVLLTYSDNIRNEFQDQQAYQDYLKKHCMELQKILRSIDIEKPVKIFFDYTSFDQFKNGTLDGIVAIPVGKDIEVPTERLYPLQYWTHRYRWPYLALFEILKIKRDIPDASIRRAALIRLRYGKYLIKDKLDAVVKAGIGGTAGGALAGGVAGAAIGGGVGAVGGPVGIVIGLAVGGVAGAVTGGATGGIGGSTAAAAILAIDRMKEIDRTHQTEEEHQRTIEN